MSTIAEKASSLFGRMTTVLRPKKRETQPVDDIHVVLSTLLEQHKTVAVENYIDSRVPYPTVMKKIYQENPVFFTWLVTKKLLFDDVYSILEAYSVSPDATERVVDTGMRGAQLKTAVDNFTKNEMVAAFLLDHHSDLLTQELAAEALDEIETYCTSQPDVLLFLLKNTEDLALTANYVSKLVAAEISEEFLARSQDTNIENGELRIFFSMLEGNVDLVKTLLTDKVPFALYEQILFFESNITQYSQITLVTHALRAEHYLKMLATAEERGPETGFQLRSKEENNILGIGVKSYSPNGRGAELEAGEEFVSTTLNAVAGLYGDIVFVGKASELLHKKFSFRALDFSLQNGLHARGELSVFTQTGRKIHAVEQLALAEKFVDEKKLAQAQEIFQQVHNEFPSSEQRSVDVRQNITTLRNQLEQEITQAPADGISLHNSNFICLVPEDQYQSILTAIEESSLHPTIQEALKAQLISFTGGLNADLIMELRDPEVFKEKTNAVAGVLQDDKTTSTYNDAEVALASPAVSVATGVYQFSETPSIDLSDRSLEKPIRAFQPDNCIALLYSLQDLAEWSFLQELPRSYWGVIYGPLSYCVEYVYQQVKNSSNPVAQGSESTQIFKRLGVLLQTPLKDLSPSDNSLMTKIFTLSQDSDITKAPVTLWKESLEEV